MEAVEQRLLKSILKLLMCCNLIYFLIRVIEKLFFQRTITQILAISY